MAARDDIRRIIGQEYGLSSDPLEAELGLAAEPGARQQQLFAEGGVLIRELQKRREQQMQEKTTSGWDPRFWRGVQESAQERPDVVGAETISSMSGERFSPVGPGASDIQRDIASVLFASPGGQASKLAETTSPEDVEEYFKSREMTSRYDEGLPEGTRAQLEAAGTLGDIGIGVGAGVTAGLTRGGQQATKIGRLSRRKRGTVGDIVGTKPNKAMKDRVREEIRQELADPTTGEPIAEGVKIPDKLIQERVRDARLRQAMLSERVEAGLGEKPYLAHVQEEPLPGGARYAEGIGMEEGSTLSKPSEIRVSQANLREMSEAAQLEQIGHEVGHGAAHGLQRQAPATQAWRQAEQDMIERLHTEKIRRKYGAEPADLDELLEYHGELERGMGEELAGEGGPAAQEAGQQLKGLQEADLRQIYRPNVATGQMRHGPDEGIADLFQMMSENPEQLTPSVRQLLINAGFKL